MINAIDKDRTLCYNRDGNNGETGPRPEFDAETGCLYMTDGETRRTVARIDRTTGEILIFWRTRTEKREIPLKIEEVIRALIK